MRQHVYMYVYARALTAKTKINRQKEKLRINDTLHVVEKKSLKHYSFGRKTRVQIARWCNRREPRCAATLIMSLGHLKSKIKQKKRGPS